MEEEVEEERRSHTHLLLQWHRNFTARNDWQVLKDNTRTHKYSLPDPCRSSAELNTNSPYEWKCSSCALHTEYSIECE